MAPFALFTRSYLPMRGSFCGMNETTAADLNTPGAAAKHGVVETLIAQRDRALAERDAMRAERDAARQTIVELTADSRHGSRMPEPPTPELTEPPAEEPELTE